MIIKMNRNEFEAFSDEELGKACFKPLIETYKGLVANQATVHDLQIKENFYHQLNEGQQALFMFYMIYNHICKSYVEFYWWNAYFWAQPKSWGALKRSMSLFKDEAFLLLLEKIEEELKRYKHPVSLEHFNVTRDGLIQNEALLVAMKKLYEEFTEIAPSTVEKVNYYIKQNSADFVRLV